MLVDIKGTVSNVAGYQHYCYIYKIVGNQNGGKQVIGFLQQLNDTPATRFIVCLNVVEFLTFQSKKCHLAARYKARNHQQYKNDDESDIKGSRQCGP